MKKIGNLFKRLVLIFIIVYAIATFFSQQKILNTYAANREEIAVQLDEANNYQKQLNELKENVNSEEYIKDMAREKLDMYLPNERVYIISEQ